MRDFRLHTIRLLTLLPLLGIVFLQSCVRGDEFDTTPQANLEALWTMIDEHYCFLDYKHEAIGLDWNEVHQRYASKISPTMSNIQLFEVLSGMLSELRDGHVNLYCSADVGRNWSWFEDYPKNLDQEVRDAYLGTDYRIAGGLKYRILPDNIGYVVYESFSAGIGESNISNCLYYLRSCNGLILDVRGNGGGQLSNCDLLTSHFTNERIHVGYSSHKTGKAHNAFSKPEAEYINPSTGIRWQKDCIVLTNRECYSATNAFVRNMKECAKVTVLGDQTGGGSGLPFTSELPNGWTVRFSACPMYDTKMQHTEFGIEPDINVSLDPEALKRGEDSLIEEARRMLK